MYRRGKGVFGTLPSVLLAIGVVVALSASLNATPLVPGETEGASQATHGTNDGPAALILPGSAEHRNTGATYASLDEIPLSAMVNPFSQTADDLKGEGIYLTSSGEPKSGTTWLGRLVVGLCLHLCGNQENTWCEMRDVRAIRNRPAPWYIFDMVNINTGDVFLHYNGWIKHEIFGLEARHGCARGGIKHNNGFGKTSPCPELDPMTREGLVSCLPDSSPSCLPYLPPQDPAERRMAVVFRDPRDEVISEHRMRTEVFGQDMGELEPFIRQRFEIMTAWVHQRWVWHTTVMKSVSRVMFYEELQADPVHLVELAKFVGLECTQAEADALWRKHAFSHLPNDYTTYGLSTETLKWMNGTLLELLPQEMLVQYDLAVART